MRAVYNLWRSLGVEKITHVLPTPDLFFTPIHFMYQAVHGFWLFLEGCGILVPQAGIKNCPPLQWKH